MYNLLLDNEGIQSTGDFNWIYVLIVTTIVVVTCFTYQLLKHYCRRNKWVTIKYGSTRICILLTNMVIKIPSFVEYRLFLNGILGNLQETGFSKLESEKLCPVKFSFIGGLLIIMPRAKPLSRSEFFSLDYGEFIKDGNLTIPVENKLDSFGWLNGKIVAIDYGS